MDIRRALVIHKRSRYEIYVKEHHDVPVQKALARGDAAAHRLRSSHAAQRTAFDTVRRTLKSLGIDASYRLRESRPRSNRPVDLVITVGGDGTVLHTAGRITDDTPLVGINSDPAHSVGRLCAGTADDIAALIDDLRAGRLKPEPRARLRARVDGATVLGPVLNDVLYAHYSPADMTRCQLALRPSDDAFADTDDGFEDVRSSGIWVSTGTGSTSALRSAGGKTMPPGSRRMQYVVREPYVPPDQPRPRRVGAMVEPGRALVLISRVRRGMLWADGAHRRFKVPYGARVAFDTHPAPLRLVRRDYRDAS